MEHWVVQTTEADLGLLRHPRWSSLWLQLAAGFASILNPLSANPTIWSNTLKQFVGKLRTNCLSVFHHFVILALKGLTISFQMISNISALNSRHNLVISIQNNIFSFSFNNDVKKKSQQCKLLLTKENFFSFNTVENMYVKGTLSSLKQF